MIKKAFMVFLTVLLTLCWFASCDEKEYSRDNETTCTSSADRDTDAKESNADEHIVVEPSTLLTNYSDYDEYLETNAKLLPDDFVAYGELKALGEFVDFVLPVKGDHSYYLYSLKDSTGFLITVAITHIDTSKDISITQDSIVLPNKPSDLISTNDYRAQNIVFNNIRYSYDADGNLVYVTTQVEDVTITFSPGSVFVPDDSESSGEFVRMRFTDYKAERENILTCLLAGNEEEKDLASFLKNDNETSSQSGQNTHEEGSGSTIENNTDGAEQESNTESPNGNGSSVPSQSETEKSEQESGAELASESESSLPSQSETEKSEQESSTELASESESSLPSQSETEKSEQESGTELASESESSLPSQSETEKSEQESSTEIRNTAECQYVSFDEILSNVTDMVKARFVGVTIESGGVYNYEFEVIESLRGMAKEERIIVSDIAADCIVLNSEISFSTYDVKYVKGNSYLLLLRRSSSVYDSEYKFSFAHPSLIIPLDKDRNNNIIPAESTLYEESISKHMGSVEASDALSKATLEEYILNAIKSNPTVKDDGSIDSINMKEILLGSQYVLEVTIEYIDNNPTFANDRVVCNCKVISVLKGDYEKENPTIVFTSGDYKEGETYIVAVNLIDGATILTMSSANSIFSVGQKDEILDIIAE